MLVGVIEALNETVSERYGNGAGEVTDVEVESALHDCVFNTVHNLLLDEPALVAKIRAHQLPQLRIELVVLSRFVLEFRL